MSLARRLFPAAAPGSLGMTVLFMFTAVSLFAIFWGRTNPVTIEVVKFDAGDVRQFAVHKVVAYPQQHLYIVGMPDGRLRAIDGRVEGSDCKVEWLPNDDRGAVRNPQGLPGIYRDPCSGAIWSFEGNAISGADQPLRTPVVTPDDRPDGTQRVQVELVNPSR